MPSPLDDARAAFANEGLPFPPVPEALLDNLQVFAKFVYGTSKPAGMLYDIGIYIPAALDAKSDDFVLIGFDGYGFNSWAVHYYLVQGPLALFLQFAWGGVFINVAQARAKIAAAFELAAAIQADMAEVAGRIPSGRRLVVVASEFRGGSWTWIDTAASAAPKWQENRFAALDAAAAALRSVADGTAEPL